MFNVKTMVLSAVFCICLIVMSGCITCPVCSGTSKGDLHHKCARCSGNGTIFSFSGK